MKRVHYIISLLLISGVWGVNLYGQLVEYNHPELSWLTIDTEHFQVHYHKGAERTAALVAKIAEEIYAPITSLYLYQPDGKIHFIIRDHDDYSNGSTYYYDNKIEIWATPMDFVLRGNHNWLRNVVTHEFTHMISLGAARKLPRKIPAFYFQYMGYEPEKNPYVLYGFPNRIVSYPIATTTVPNWLAEGVAQYQLSKLNYDNWDTHRDMILRTAALEGTLLNHREMGVFGKNSFGNEKVYNHGYALVIYIAETYGVESLRRIFQELQSPFHYTVNDALKDVLGKSERQLYREWKRHLETMYNYRVSRIVNNVRTGKIIEAQGFANLFPCWAPHGTKFAFVSNRGHDYLSQSSLYIHDLAKGTTEKIKSGVSSSLSWSPDGEKIAYSRTSKPNKSGSHFQDIYIYDLKKKRERPITRNLRAQHPDWSPDGSKLLFVTIKDGTQNIAVLDLKTRKMAHLTKFKDGQQIFTPRWAPSGNAIVFSYSKGEGRQIGLIASDGKTLKILIADDHDARDPVFSPNGKEIYFSWDRTGIFNIYSFELATKNTKQLTNVLGGAFMPSVNRQGQLLYSDFNSQGYRIAYMERPAPVDEHQSQYLAYRSTNAQLASRENQDIYLINQGISDKTVNFNDAEVPRYSTTPYTFTYSSLAFLPRIMIDYGTVKVGTYLYSSDILNKYDIFASFAMNRDRDYDLFGMVNYRKFRPTVFLEVYNRLLHHAEMDNHFYPFGADTTANPPDTTLVKFKYNLTEVDAGLDFKLNDEQNLRTAFVLSRYRGTYHPLYTYPNGQEYPSTGYNYFIGRAIQVNWTYKNVLPSISSEINPAAGRIFSLKYSQEFNKFIRDFTITKYGTWVEDYDDYNYAKFELDWKEFIPLFNHGRHALNINLQAGWIDRPVHEFFNFYAGGLVGLRGYPYYSIEGTKMLVTRTSYRFPIFNNMNVRLHHLHFDKLYLSAFFDYGNAFHEDALNFSKFKKTAGAELRLDLISFYNFPIKIFFNAAYGMDQFTKRESNNTLLTYGKEWRYYLGISFGYFD